MHPSLYESCHYEIKSPQTDLKVTYTFPNKQLFWDNKKAKMDAITETELLIGKKYLIEKILTSKLNYFMKLPWIVLFWSYLT